MADPAFLQSAFTWLIWGVAMTLAMGALSPGRDKSRPRAEGSTLVHPRALLVLGISGVAFFLVLAAISLALADVGWGFALFFLAFALLGVPSILDFYRVRHEVTPDGLQYGTRLQGRHALEWVQVTSVRYSLFEQCFLVSAPGKPVARISALMMGLPAFAESVLHHVPGTCIDPQTRQVLLETAQGNPPRLWN